MSEEFEQAHETLEHVAEGHESGRRNRRAAILIAVMAAFLALTEFAEKDAQTNYLSNHILASDTWAQYQAKSIRRTVLTAEAETLESDPKAATDPAIQGRIVAARTRADRMRSEPGAMAWSSWRSGPMRWNICAIMNSIAKIFWKSPAAACKSRLCWHRSQSSSICRY